MCLKLLIFLPVILIPACASSSTAFHMMYSAYILCFPGGSEVKASACNAGDLGLIPGVGRPPEERNGNLLQYPCLENPIDRGVWWATLHRVAVTHTRLSDYICMHPSLTIMLFEVHTCCNVPSREILLRFPLQSRACYPESKSKKN